MVDKFQVKAISGIDGPLDLVYYADYVILEKNIAKLEAECGKLEANFHTKTKNLEQRITSLLDLIKYLIGETK